MKLNFVLELNLGVFSEAVNSKQRRLMKVTREEIDVIIREVRAAIVGVSGGGEEGDAAADTG